MEHLPAKKSLGQNFLKNPTIAGRIADSADLRDGETVLEIGPGTGMLTDALLKKNVRVIALEADERAIPILEERFKAEIESKQLTLIHGDIRTYDLFSILPKPYKLVANIPYYLSGMLFRMFLESKTQPSTLVFLVQKEVAERIARSKKETLLSLSIKAYGTPSYEGTVSRGNFTPQPRVDSAILKISNISKESFTTLDETWFFTVLKAGFSAKRKYLLHNLSSIAPKTTLVEAFDALSIQHSVRGEDMPIETWLLLAKALSPQTKK